MTVASADPASRWRAALPSGDLALRICSALVLAPLAVVAAYVGGWPFALFWSLAALGVLWEWTALVAAAGRLRPVLVIGALSLSLVVTLVAAGHLLAAFVVFALGTLASATFAPADRRIWTAGAIPYAGALGVAPIVLRADTETGFVAIIFLFAVVWTTDIVAYFVGRIVGGPKLMPRVSPKKTWSGALAGTAVAVAVAVNVAKAAGLTGLFAVALIALVLSICSQLGDLFESFLKRSVGAKDSGHVIPGHGGLMDRLDGFVAAAAVAALIGVVRGGFATPGQGLLVW